MHYWTEYQAIVTEERICIPQLTENTTYYFKIQPKCADGDGLQSETSDPISTEMIIPSQPGKPKYIHATYDSIEIEWTKPERGAHNITSYTVLYTGDMHILNTQLHISHKHTVVYYAKC